MIVGSGLLAKGFEEISDKHQKAIFMCSGVSGSTVLTEMGCQREKLLVNNLIELNPDKIFVYTSSLCCFAASSLYDKHKLDVEKMVTANKFLIVRIGHLVGQQQSPWQFFPSILSKIRAGNISVVDGRRDIISLMDYVLFVDQLLNAGCNRLSTSFGALHPPKVIQIVEYLESKFGHCEKTIVAGTESYSQPEFVILGKDYYKKVIDRFIYESDRP